MNYCLDSNRAEPIGVVKVNTYQVKHIGFNLKEYEKKEDRSLNFDKQIGYTNKL